LKNNTKLEQDLAQLKESIFNHEEMDVHHENIDAVIYSMLIIGNMFAKQSEEKEYITHTIQSLLLDIILHHISMTPTPSNIENTLKFLINLSSTHSHFTQFLSSPAFNHFFSSPSELLSTYLFLSIRSPSNQESIQASAHLPSQPNLTVFPSGPLPTIPTSTHHLLHLLSNFAEEEDIQEATLLHLQELLLSMLEGYAQWVDPLVIETVYGEKGGIYDRH
jgi:hypothetical protein